MGRPSPAAPPRAPHGEREARRRLGQGQGRRLRGACCLPRASRGPADRGRPRRVRAHRLAPAGNSICWVSGPAGRGLVETVGGFAGSAAGGRGHVRAREDREQAAQTGAGVRSGVRFRQFFEGPQFPYGVQAQAVGEGVRGPVLAGRRAVREPDVAGRSAQAGPERVSGAVDAPHRASTGQGAPTARAVAQPVRTRSTGSSPYSHGEPSGTSTLRPGPAPVSSMRSHSSRWAAGRRTLVPPGRAAGHRWRSRQDRRNRCEGPPSTWPQTRALGAIGHFRGSADHQNGCLDVS